MRFGVGLIGPLNSDPHRRLAPKVVQKSGSVPLALSCVRPDDDLPERRFAGTLKSGRALRNHLCKLRYEVAKAGDVTMQIWVGQQ